MVERTVCVLQSGRIHQYLFEPARRLIKLLLPVINSGHLLLVEPPDDPFSAAADVEDGPLQLSV